MTGNVQFIPMPTTPAGRKPSPEYEKVRELVDAPIGGCVTFPAGTLGITSVRKLARRIASIAYSVGGAGWTTTRYYDGGVGVWKIDNPTKVLNGQGASGVSSPVRLVR